MNTGFTIAYHPDTPVVGLYPHRRYKREDGETTGTMPAEKFNLLKDSIQESGVINPIIVEHMFAEVDGHTSRVKCLAVSVGNNRVECMNQLGIEKAAVLFVVPNYVVDSLPEGCETIPQDENLLSRVRELWCEVIRADEELGYADAWSESGTLQTLVRTTLPNPNDFVAKRRRT